MFPVCFAFYVSLLCYLLPLLSSCQDCNSYTIFHFSHQAARGLQVHGLDGNYVDAEPKVWAAAAREEATAAWYQVVDGWAV